VELADTAGQRAGADGLEAQGITRARAAVEQADLCLWVLDASAPPLWPEVPSERLRLVINKTDLPPAWDLQQAPDAAHVSAREGAGLNELCQALAGWLVPDPPPPGAAVPFTPDLCSRLEEVRNELSAGKKREALRLLESLME
jgi:tRNA modification GTPase